MLISTQLDGVALRAGASVFSLYPIGNLLYRFVHCAFSLILLFPKRKLKALLN